ncbi:MAG: hypothetical protein EOO50_13315 [Flavobacterium sp.]|uniref:hypothetical protein n=1 Tax=Flavobacterium sp. TaxID=239 RepID=UPI0011F63C39|nr:hypothetical protein [Flavobacterium sp.]RZJ65623.1 MAG: hypothetical protein EOO50_13315 [Flavobacterium sp.]
MNNLEFIQKIDWALESLPMSNEIRELFIELRNNPPELEADKFDGYLKWMELLVMLAQIGAEFSKYK